MRGDRERNVWDDVRQGAGELATALATLARDWRGHTGSLPFKIGGLSDHAPIYYATLLWNARLASASSDSDDSYPLAFSYHLLMDLTTAHLTWPEPASGITWPEKSTWKKRPF